MSGSIKPKLNRANSYNSLSHFTFRNRNLIVGIIFCLILIILLWGETRIKNYSNIPVRDLLEELQDEGVEGGLYWEGKRRESLAQKEFELVRKRNENIADWYFEDPTNRTIYNTASCAPYPSFTDLVFTNQYWQVFESSTNGIIYIYSAGYDDRNKSSPVIRLVTMINRLQFTQQIFCQLWFKNKSHAVLSDAVEVSFIWLGKELPGRDGLVATYMVTCDIPKNARDDVPVSVSIVNEPCHMASNNIKVYNNRPEDGQKDNFGVCIRAIDYYYDNNAVNLVEWIELQNILGVGKIFFYIYRAKDDFQKVLDYYKDLGRIEVNPFTVPGQLIPYPFFIYDKEKQLNGWLLELMAYHDCLFRNMYNFKYLSFIDIDEVFIPMNGYDWVDMFEDIYSMMDPNEIYTYFKTAHTRFWMDWNLDNTVSADIPSYMPMLKHVTRIDFLEGWNAPKGFFDTNYTLTLHNHWPLRCVGECKIFDVPTNITHMNHYRLKYYKDVNGPFIIDKTIWRYKDALIKRTTAALIEIGLLDEKTGEIKASLET